MGTPADSLAFLLSKTAKKALVALETQLDALDLTVRQYLLLSVAASGANLSQQELAKKLDLDPTILVKLIDSLEARDLLERARATDDRRRHQLTLTPAGKKLLHDARTREVQAERALSPHTDELRNLLREFLAP